MPRTFQPYPGVFATTPSRAEIKAARAAGGSVAVEVCKLCQSIGRPELAADFVARGLTVAEAQRELAVADRGARPEPLSLDAALAHANRMTPAAIDKLWDAAISQARARY
jgi:hypothetical protein